MNAQNNALTTPLDAFRKRVQTQPEKIAMIQPLGGGELREYTWKQMDDEARRAAAWLKQQDLPQGSTIALMSKNCAEWIMADLAIWMAGHISVPLYPTLTSDSVRQIVEHSESRVFIAGKLDVWDEAKNGIPDGLINISLSLSPADARKAFTDWEEIIKSTDPLSESEIHSPDPQDLATIIYTSGTTGMPKGVMHDFRNLSVMGEKLPDVYNLEPEDRQISYLPLSHVAERAAVELAMFYVGQRVFFAESLETFGEDIQRARPTLFFAVPRIWNKFYQKASDKMPPEKLNKLLKIPLLNRVIKKKILSAMGLDECRIALSGASALSPEVIEWFRKLGLEILEVYGMTENMAWSHATREGDQNIGWVGTPHEGVDHKIGEGGEVLVRSAANMKGYFKEPEKTAETLDDDGWLYTGDVGEIDSQGRLRITGRVKEIFKTEKGKYVAPAPIENKLVSYPGLEQACVTGANLSQPIALACLSEEETAHLNNDKAIQDYIKGLEKQLEHVNKEIDAHERLDALVVVPETWSVENNMLTPTMKLKRNEIEGHYMDKLPEWAKKGGVIWAR
jgi:long-chain acyl-CoA synthetase